MIGKYTIIGCLVVINTVLSTVLFLDQQTETMTPPSPQSPVDVDAVASYWKEQVKEFGGAEAYRSFLAWADPVSIDNQHTLAHVMGGLLYDELGKDGLVVCDSSFSFGCYHEFLGRAIHYEGLGIVSELNQACVDNLGSQALSCSHGLGHGILTYLGYEEDHLKKALIECSDLAHSDPIGGCNGGVFMEYNMRTMLSLDGVGVRESKDNDIHYPCSVLSEEFVRACYYWQPQWWTSRNRVTTEDTFTSMGTWCRELDSNNLRRACFEGVGNITGQNSGYDPEKTISLCKSAADGDHMHELYCRSTAANTFFVIPSVREDAEKVCKGFTDDALERCLKYSNNTFNQLVSPE